MQTDIATTAEAEEAAAIPRMHEVHADPAQRPATPPAALRGRHAGKSPARWAYERLIHYIQAFEERLDADHEVAMGFTGGEAGVIRIEGLGYFDPDIVTFYGSSKGARTQIVQHVTQLNVLLRAVPRHADRPEPMRIGFRLARDLETAAPDGAG